MRHTNEYIIYACIKSIHTAVNKSIEFTDIKIYKSSQHSWTCSLVRHTWETWEKKTVDKISHIKMPLHEIVMTMLMYTCRVQKDIECFHCSLSNINNNLNYNCDSFNTPDTSFSDRIVLWISTKFKSTKFKQSMSIYILDFMAELCFIWY